MNCHDSVPSLKKILVNPISLGFESDDYTKLFDIHSDYFGVFVPSCKSLGRVARGDDTAVDLLAEKLLSAPEDYKDCVIRSLADLGDPKATEPLLTFLNGELDFLRIEAIRALGEIRAQEAWDKLKALYIESYEKGKDEFDPEVQAIAESK